MKRRPIALALVFAFFATAGAASAHEPYFDDDGCGGALSCSSEAVGDAIALPFRLIGDVVDFIF